MTGGEPGAEQSPAFEGEHIRKLVKLSPPYVPSLPFQGSRSLFRFDTDARKNKKPSLTPWPTEAEVERVRECVRRDRPFGSADWTKATAGDLGLEYSLRPRGRPPGKGAITLDEKAPD